MPVAIYVGLSGGHLWWLAAAGAYAGVFLGLHVLLIPLMTAWHALEARLERMVRGIVEEELLLYDLKTYDRQLGRVVEEWKA